MSRFALATGMNGLVPGTGLILLGRQWLGIALAAWFALGAEAAACARLIAPVTLPGLMLWVGLGSAVAAWGLAQALLFARIRFLCDPGLPAELARLQQHAEQALQQSDVKAARSALLIALSIDDSDLTSRVLWARLLSATASPARARRAWQAAARLDATRRFANEINDALGQSAAV